MLWPLCSTGAPKPARGVTTDPFKQGRIAYKAGYHKVAHPPEWAVVETLVAPRYCRDPAAIIYDLGPKGWSVSLRMWYEVGFCGRVIDVKLYL